MGTITGPPPVVTDGLSYKLAADNVRSSFGEQRTMNSAYFDNMPKGLRSTDSIFQLGDQSYTFGCWFNPDNFQVGSLFYKVLEYQLYIEQSGVDQLRFSVHNGTAWTNSTSVFAWTPGLWQLAIGSYDHVTKDVKVSIRGRDFDSVALTGTPNTTSNDFQLGGDSPSLEGSIRNGFLIKRLITIDEVQRLDMLGPGLEYSDLDFAFPPSFKKSLVSWWNCDEATGSRIDSHGVYDLSNADNVLSLSDSLPYRYFDNLSTDEVIVRPINIADYDVFFAGGSFNFDGISDEVDYFNDDALFNWEYNTGDLTYEMWFNANDLSGLQTMYSHAFSNGGFRISLLNATGELACEFSNTFGSAARGEVRSSVSAITPGNWYHLIYVRSATNSVAGDKLYINGVDDTNILQDAAPATGFPANATSVLGKRANSGSDYYEGKINDFAIYRDKQFTANEAAQNWNAQRDKFGL